MEKTRSNREQLQKMIRQMKRQAGQRTNTVRHKGVYRNNGKWTANIYVGGKTVYLGIYHTEIEAAAACELAQSHKGDADFEDWLAEWKKRSEE